MFSVRNMFSVHCGDNRVFRYIKYAFKIKAYKRLCKMGCAKINEQTFSQMCRPELVISVSKHEIVSCIGSVQ